MRCRWHLTIEMDPKEVHDIGLKEVARIKKNMEHIKEKVNFNGSLKDFLEHMRKDKDLYVDSKEKLLEEYRDIVYSHIEPKLSDLFDRMPNKKVLVREMPFNGPGGMYFQPSTDGSRPGVFFVNLNSPEERPRFTMVSLSLHEGSPGHHFQLARQVELDLPSFRKEQAWMYLSAAPFNFPMYMSYVEGWALYAESLGEEMGAYRDDYDLLGRYLDEIMRAVRLVVDTGIHVLGWSRQQAINYMMEYSCDPLDQVEIEIDRYITWPGQACGYKIGELKIKELRNRAKCELGKNFDIKEFHDVVLRSGSLSLSMLEDIVLNWIRSRKG